MKLTKQQLKQVIREELEKALKESNGGIQTSEEMIKILAPLKNDIVRLAHGDRGDLRAAVNFIMQGLVDAKGTPPIDDGKKEL